MLFVGYNTQNRSNKEIEILGDIKVKEITHKCYASYVKKNTET